MPEKYNSRLKTLLNEQLEVPEGRSGDEVKETLLGFEADGEEVKNVLSDVAVLHLDEASADFLEEYMNQIDHSMEFARELYSDEEGKDSIQSHYRSLLSLIQELSNDLNRAVNEDNELGTIARKLKDAHLLAEVDYEREQLQRTGEKLESLLERKDRLETLVDHFEDLDNYVRDRNLIRMLEHRKHVLELMIEHSEETSSRTSGPVRVHIPEEMLDSIQGLASNYVEECTGYFICRREGKDWTALMHVLSGVGDETSVASDDEKRKAVNELVERYPRYRIIEFHTHSVGTIRRHGPEFGENWSKQDLENFKAQGDGYIGMLITPTHVLIKSNGFNSEWKSVKNSSIDGFKSRRDQLTEKWREVSSDYSFSDLPDMTPFKE